jgi:CRISPR-associated protein Cas2
MNHHHWLIVYDICDPKRLRNIEKTISRYGIRVQKSVFESDVDEVLIGNLQRRIGQIIEGDDFVTIFPLCEKDWQRVERYGITLPHQYITGPYEIL